MRDLEGGEMVLMIVFRLKCLKNVGRGDIVFVSDFRGLVSVYMRTIACCTFMFLPVRLKFKAYKKYIYKFL